MITSKQLFNCHIFSLWKMSLCCSYCIQESFAISAYLWRQSYYHIDSMSFPQQLSSQIFAKRQMDLTCIMTHEDIIVRNAQEISTDPTLSIIFIFSKLYETVLKLHSFLNNVFKLKNSANIIKLARFCANCSKFLCI